MVSFDLAFDTFVKSFVVSSDALSRVSKSTCNFSTLSLLGVSVSNFFTGFPKCFNVF